MKKTLRKSGQKFIRKFSRVSLKVGEEGKEHLKRNFFGKLRNFADIRLLILEWGLLVLALIMLASTQAFWFGESYAGDAFVEGGTYIEGTVGKVSSLNPLFATTNSEKVLSRLMFETLTTVDYSGNIGMGLAKSITPSESGKIWTLELKNGLKWSDGEELTIDDVMFTIGLIKNSAVNSIYSATLAGVKAEKNEEGKIVFTLPAAYADFPSTLNIPIVPKHELEDADPRTLIEDDFSNTPITSGAFSFNAIQSASKEERVFYLAPNPSYRKRAVMVSNFAVHTYNTVDDVIHALNTNEITATAEINSKKADELKIGQFYRKNSSINSGVFIFFNTGSGVFKSRDLRLAVRQGIDLEKLREKAPETNKLDYPILKTSLELSNYPEIPAQDFESAKTKIQENYDGATIRVATINSGYFSEVTEELNNQLQALGFKTDFSVSEEAQEFITNTVSRRNYDILVYEIELGADPDPLAYYHSSQATSNGDSSAGLNLANYRNALVDDLLIGARETLDASLRIAKYENFLKYLAEDVPTIGLYQTNLTYFYNKNTRAFGDNVRLVTALDRFSDVSNYAVMKELKNKTP